MSVSANGGWMFEDVSHEPHALPRFLRRGETPQPSIHAAPRLRLAVLTVLLPFAVGYYLSYLFRTINALISENLVAEFALSPDELATLTAVLFLAFALTQLPLGAWLDRFGPRRVQAVLLTIAAIGAALFAGAQSFATLLFGRALIGIGIAGALMAGLKGIVLWFPAERVALANGAIVTIGALGAVTATLPAEAVLTAIGWRGGFAILALLTAACALLIFLLVPEHSGEQDKDGLDPGNDIIAIYRDARFWRLAPLSAMCIGSAWALQGLWAGPWLADVEGLTRDDVVLHLGVMAVALSISALLLGAGADRLRHRGVPLSTSLAMAACVALLAQLALVLRWPIPSWLPWIAVAGIGAASVLSYALVTELFPRSMSGRATAALNLLHVSAAAVLQLAMGIVVAHWPTENGHHPSLAYQTALGLVLVLEALSLIWFARPDPRAIAPHLGAHPVHALAQRLRIEPHMAAPYLEARLAWTTRQEKAQRQVFAWRSAAFASCAVLTVLSGAFAAVLSGSVFSGSSGRAQYAVTELDMPNAVFPTHDHLAALEGINHERHN